MLVSRFVVGTLSFSLLALEASVVSGQDYPNKPIRIITSAVGGGSDFIAREIAQGIAGPLGQQVVVDNRSGGFLAVDAALKAPPDGYTLLVAGGSLWITPLLRKADYDVLKDFSPISLIVREVNVVAVHPSVPVKSVKELIALAKAKPGALNFSTGAVGGTPHLASELFKSMAGIDMARIAYRGSAPAVTSLLSGETQVIVMDAGLVMTHVTSGRLRALAVTSAEPSALVPGLPTVAASGLPGYEMIGITGLLAPGRPPAAIINRLNQEVVRTINRADVKERFLKAGVEAVGSSPKQLADAIESDMNRLGKVIKDSGLRIE